MPMPAQKRHRSKQDYGTPRELIAAIEQRFGTLTFDVAASVGNAVVPRYFSENEGGPHPSAFEADWSLLFTPRDLLFLNPPFGGIGQWWAPLVTYWTRRLPWLRLLMLTPASIGSEWYQQHVSRQAMVLGLSPRLTFVGTNDPYPKDCMLSGFGFGVVGVDVWRWDGTAPGRLKADHPGRPEDAPKRARKRPKAA